MTKAKTLRPWQKLPWHIGDPRAELKGRWKPLAEYPRAMTELMREGAWSMPSEPVRPTNPRTGRPRVRWGGPFAYVDDVPGGLTPLKRSPERPAPRQTVVTQLARGGPEVLVCLLWVDGCFFPIPFYLWNS